MTNTATSNYRKVLIEDYTGHCCPNCPPAGLEAEEIEAATHGGVVVIANHVTYTFARPRSDTNYKEDFRNPTSDAWDDKSSGFGISLSGLPKGMVNRMDYTTSTHPKGYSSWSSLANQQLAKPQVAKLDLTTWYDPVSHYVSIKVKTTFKATLPNPVNISVVLTQDSIVSDQQDNSPPANAQLDPDDPIRRLNYRFDNINLGSLNGTWGELVSSTPLNKDTVTKFYGCNLVDKCYFKGSAKTSAVCVNDNYVNVVAFVYDVTTREVLQVEKLRIKPGHE
jgi:hypothetical protein